jgi:nucleotide-binding universal stress UspA family protein
VVNAQAVAQFTANGSLESTATGGTVVASAGSENPSTASVFQSNGDYLLANELFTGLQSRAHNASVQVLRFTANGSSDSTFANASFHYSGAGGSGIEAIANSVAVQSNGDLVVVGAQSTLSQSGAAIVNGLTRLTRMGPWIPVSA